MNHVIEHIPAPCIKKKKNAGFNRIKAKATERVTSGNSSNPLVTPAPAAAAGTRFVYGFRSFFSFAGGGGGESSDDRLFCLRGWPGGCPSPPLPCQPCGRMVVLRKAVALSVPLSCASTVTSQ